MRTTFAALAMAVLTTATMIGQTGTDLLKETTNMKACYTRFLPFGISKAELLDHLKRNGYRIVATNDVSVAIQDNGYNYAFFFKKGKYASIGMQISEQTRLSALSTMKMLGDLAMLQNDKAVTNTPSSKMYVTSCDEKTHFVSASIDNDNKILIIYGWIFE